LTLAHAEQLRKTLKYQWDEFQALPAKASAINERLGDVRTTRDALNDASLTANFRQLYAEGLDGKASAFGFVDQVALALLTSRLRIDVLNSQEADLTAQLDSLRQDNRRLSKALGRAPH
jgi:prefoldin subunit 5